MKNIYKMVTLLIVVILLVGTAIVQQTIPARAAVGFHISGRNLVDANGNNFIIRGLSHAHTFFPAQTSTVANVKAKGANTIRIVLSGGRWGTNGASDVANMINLCKVNKLICVLDDQDTTGYGEDAGATSLATAVNYWKSIQSVLTGQENYVIINIGNEPYGNAGTTANWVTDTKNAIAAMRAAGFQHTLMVDAPNWGQDWSGVMKNNAASVFASDPNRNTIFSVHMYGVYNTASTITSYVSSFVNAGLPLVIGEFGFNHSDGNPDEDTIMATAQANGIGYMAWSWSGNGGGVEYLDMVTGFNPNQPSAWGSRVFTGANGFSSTSQEASVFGAPILTSTATTALGPNLALNKPATSSSNDDAARTPNLAVDGNTSTRWSSAYSDPQWLQVDLGSTMNINRVILRWEAAYGKSYQIQTSNDATNWTSIYSTTTGAGGVNDLTGLSGSGRYIRMVGTGRGTAWGYSLYEFEVYGSAGGPTSTATVTATKTNTSTVTATPTITPTGVITNTPTRTNTASVTPTNPPSMGLKVQYRAGDTVTGDNQVRPYFIVVNGGTSSVALSGLKIRYYFSENTTQAMSTWCDYASLACTNITTAMFSMSPVTGADHYIEVGFGAGAGSLAAGATSGEVQTRFNKNDWSNFNEADDYSFDATKTAYTDWTKVALYNNGVLVWGTPPGGNVATNTVTPTATTTTCACFTNTPTRTVTPTVTASATGPTPTPTVTPTSGVVTHLANPFVGATFYVNHDWRGSATYNVNTFLWLDSIAAVNGTGAYPHSLVNHLDMAKAQGANAIGIVVYDLPNRDCSALSSNGELLIANNGSARYKAEYIDVIAGILSRPEYANLRIVAVIEPDSLPNLITNASAYAKCQEALSTTDGYVANTTYTLNKLYPIRNVYSYIDIAHAGWLGWPNNFNPAVTMISNMIKGTAHGVNSVDGFIDNTANTQVETETFLDANTNVGGNPVRSGSYFDWNDYIDESHYAAAWKAAMQAAGLPASSTNMLIDTSRNGWGGCGGGPFALQTCRPTKTSTSTVLDTYINESRIDRRPAKGDWCNQNGAGIGKLPSATALAPYQAYVWVKPPGESDGSSTLIPTGPLNPDGKGLDGMCDPNYMGNGLNENMNSNALPNAPLSGAWFQAQFDQLVANKFP